MSRVLRVAAAQSGPIQKADSRQAVVQRMADLLDQAKARNCDLIVYPELALTTFFPRWYMTNQAEIDVWFEREMPNHVTRLLFEKAAHYKIGLSFGYAELTPDGQHFNTSILVNRDGKVVGKYRKVHLPGHAEFDPERSFQHLEKRYFLPGNLGFNVWRTMGGILGMCICNDRRWPETYRVMGLQGVEMIVLGYNTPSVNSQKASEGPELRMFQHKLSLQAGAYQNSTWVVATAKCGVEDGHPLFGGTMIVNPDGEIVAEAKTEGDELVIANCDLDATKFGKETVFDFQRHRRTEHYQRITSQIGVIWPPEDS
jgi:predicted amidohydrolase